MAVGIGGEILPETLEKMHEICNVKLVSLKESGFYNLLPKIGYLKAFSDEALFMDVEEVRKLCCVVVTHGEGCEVYWRDGKVNISPFLAKQIDPTGAGDSFLGGFVTGCFRGWLCLMLHCWEAFLGRLLLLKLVCPSLIPGCCRKLRMSCSERGKDLRFMKPAGHDQFHASLCAAKLASACAIQECQREYIGQPKLLLNPVYKQQIQTVEGSDVWEGGKTVRLEIQGGNQSSSEFHCLFITDFVLE